MKVGILKLTVNPKLLAHCKLCSSPMYCIYSWGVRHYCWECSQDMQLAEGEGIEPSHPLGMTSV